MATNLPEISEIHLEGNFETQVHQLLMTIRLTRTEVENLQDLLKDVEMALTKPGQWPGAKFYPFGSIVTGMGIRTSDVDCFVVLPEWERIQSKLVYKAKGYLAKYPYVFSDLFAIPMAKVPIVKFCHIPTGRHCDLNFSSCAGVENSKLLAYLLHQDSRALPVAIIIKYWSKVHNLTGTNLVPNYSLTLMVVFYLQTLGILPSVMSLQQTVQENIIEGWNVAFSRTEHNGRESSLSLYHLIGGFFEFYSNFNFANSVVSTYLGQTVPKASFTRDKIPQEYNLYQRNLYNRICKPLRVNTPICVQDPFDHSRNCSVAVHQKLFDTLLTHIKDAATMFYSESSENYLKVLLTKVTNNQPQIPRNHQQQHNVQNRGVMKQKNKNRIKQKINRNIHTLYGAYKGRIQGRR